ncbi:hypothetical protein ACOMHN_000256 [Nucella lapillus]
MPGQFLHYRAKDLASTATLGPQTVPSLPGQGSGLHSHTGSTDSSFITGPMIWPPQPHWVYRQFLHYRAKDLASTTRDKGSAPGMPPEPPQPHGVHRQFLHYWAKDLSSTARDSEGRFLPLTDQS